MKTLSYSQDQYG